MPVTYELDAPKALVRTRCIGNVTLPEVIDHFQKLSEDPQCPDRLDVLLDLSQQTSIPKSSDLREVTHKIRSVRGRVQFGVCAIVATTDPLYGMLRMFQVFSEELFREAAVFRCLRDAENWLSEKRASIKGRIPA
jgi:hypothetical protein